MKILLVDEFVPPNIFGSQVRNLMISRLLAKRGHEAAMLGFIAPSSSREESIDGIKVMRTGLRAIGISSHNQNARRIVPALHMFWALLREDYDVAITNPYIPLPLTIIAAKLRGKPVVSIINHVDGFATFRKEKGIAAGTIGWLLEEASLLFARLSDRVLVFSRFTKRDLLAKGVPAGKIGVTINGVALEDYPEAPKAVKEQFVYAGRHVAYKNIDHLLEAFAALLKKHPKTRLIILGSGRQTQQLKALARRLGIARSVEFAGYVSEAAKRKIIAQSVALVLTSYKEGFGMVLTEANACFRPFVAYDIPACREVTAMTKGGLLASKGNIRQLAQRMEALAKNRKMASSLGAAGRKSVEKRMTWEQCVDDVERTAMRVAK